MDTPEFCFRKETRSGPVNALQEGCDWTHFIAVFILFISLALTLMLLR